ncbi:MAG: tetratricopeptide repeat protein [Bradymonadales bacterium]|nr:tetratricopeptide repeat protein [Bradymonadales bacterium]
MDTPIVRPEEIKLVVRTAEEDFRRGNLAQAVYGLGMVLSTNPQNGSWRIMLNRICEQMGPDAPTLVPAEQVGTDPVKAAIRAYLLASVERYEQAIELLLQAAASRPDIPYLLWAVEWLRRPGVSHGLPFEFIFTSVLGGIARFTADLPSPLAEEDPRRKTVKAAADTLGLLRNVHPMAPHLLISSVLVLRRLAEWEDAIELAKQAIQLLPGWETTAGLAAVYCDAGLEDRALVTYQEAIGIDPDQIAPYLDTGDTYLKTERYQAAINAFQEALAIEPDNARAQASKAYARYKVTGEERELATLVRFAERSRRGWKLLCEVQPPHPYIHFLPGPVDQSADSLSAFMDRLAGQPSTPPSGRLTLTMACPESPSVITAFRLWCASRGIDVKVEIRVNRVPAPDPRVAKSPVELSLWRYEGATPISTIDPPDAQVVAAIAELAAEPYNLPLWEPQARQLASQLGTTRLLSLLGCMVHPPPLPEGMNPFAWVQRVQQAAALVIAYLDSGWSDSLRKRALTALAIGPVDWCVDASLVALAWIAHQEQVARPDVEYLFGWLSSQLPGEGCASCYEYPLICSWLFLGTQYEAARTRLVSWRKRLEEKKVRWKPPEND